MAPLEVWGGSFDGDQGVVEYSQARSGAARMIALIGRLPATLEDRAIVLPMRRRAGSSRRQPPSREHTSHVLDVSGPPEE